jgi:hypothetical protein
MEPEKKVVGSPADLVEAMTGVRPRSGVCILCRKALVRGVDTDHSVCNACWDSLGEEDEE